MKANFTKYSDRQFSTEAAGRAENHAWPHSGRLLQDPAVDSKTFGNTYLLFTYYII
jgi:hypothetical protein